MTHGGTQRGFTIIETLIGMGILTIVSTSIYFSYSNILEIVQTAQYNNAALSIMESRIEVARNMRYEDVGVVGGVPAGKLPQSETITLGTTPYTLHTYVRNIDDPFDGTLEGTPSDTAPADYKLLELQVTCDTCVRYRLLTMATYIAPKNLENASRNGSLFVRVLNASGVPVGGATVRVTNTNVTPAVDLTDTTDVNGMLQLVDIATSSVGYHIVVSKSGYNNDQTYPPGAPANPLKPDATVATQQLTISSLFIDRVSTVSLRVRDQFCSPIQSFDFLLTGDKLIATQPDIPKYSSALSTDMNGLFTNATMEWDSYSLRSTDTTHDIAGTLSSLSFTLNPASAQFISWMAASKSQDGLSVSVTDQNGTVLDDATVQLTAPGYDQTKISGRVELLQTDWSSGNYAEKSTLLDASSVGELTLGLSNGSYASAGTEWLISESYNLGTSSSNFASLNWTPTAQPPETGPDAVRFQLAANNDNTTWNWVGPDGTGTSFFTSSGQTTPSTLNGNRYVRYRVYLATSDDLVTPRIESVGVGFSSGCVPSGQTYFNGLSAGNYTLNITRAGYQNFTMPISIQDTWQRIQVQLSP
jgi:prepilin-type N-terminal cleavage/methylation domain-containing protein